MRTDRAVVLRQIKPGAAHAPSATSKHLLLMRPPRGRALVLSRIPFRRQLWTEFGFGETRPALVVDDHISIGTQSIQPSADDEPRNALDRSVARPAGNKHNGVWTRCGVETPDDRDGEPKTTTVG